MLAIAVEFLTGRFVATSPQDRRSPEWPPHPARLFAALVAAWAELGDEVPESRAALEWLEAQPAPLIAASQAVERSVPPHYVPVNDTSVVGLPLTERAYTRLLAAQQRLADATTESQRAGALRAMDRARDVTASTASAGSTSPDTATKLLPSRRVRKARYYPSVTPVRSRVQYVWTEARPSDEIVRALDRLLEGVTRLGHSSSLVSCYLSLSLEPEKLPEPLWVADDNGEATLRTTAEGLLHELELAYARHRGSTPRTMPAEVQRYRRGRRAAAEGVHDVPNISGDWFVFAQVTGRRLPITAAATLSSAVRAALMRYADDPPVELLSGHRPDGSWSDKPHTGVLPLPFVGTDHADGHLVGFAVQLPRESPLLIQRDDVLRAIGRWEGSDAQNEFRVTVRLRGGDAVQFERIREPAAAWTLRHRRWARPSRTWLSITPIALDRHPGNLQSANRPTAAKAATEAEDVVATACQHVGLPRPVTVAITRAALVRGTRPARAFPPFRGNGRTSPQRLLVHARIVFDREVGGPIVLGAGRYLGLGLMAPEDPR